MTDTAYGFAVQHGTEIDVRTVSPTERAAKVNHLVANCGLPILASDTDAIIERVWKQTSDGRDVVRVRIEALTH